MSETVATRIRALIGQMTQQAFADRCGMPKGTVKSLLAGANPKPATVAKVAEACGVSQDWLLNGEGRAQSQHQRQALAQKARANPAAYALRMAWEANRHYVPQPPRRRPVQRRRLGESPHNPVGRIQDVSDTKPRTNHNPQPNHRQSETDHE